LFNFTPEEKRVILFLLALSFCGLLLNSLAKINSRIEKIVYPEVGPVKLELNKADFSQLVSCGQLSTELARRILEQRGLRGSFSSLEELKEIKGIKEKRLEKLKEFFFIE